MQNKITDNKGLKRAHQSGGRSESRKRGSRNERDSGKNCILTTHSNPLIIKRATIPYKIAGAPLCITRDRALALNREYIHADCVPTVSYEISYHDGPNDYIQPVYTNESHDDWGDNCHLQVNNLTVSALRSLQRDFIKVKKIGFQPYDGVGKVSDKEYVTEGMITSTPNENRLTTYKMLVRMLKYWNNLLTLLVKETLTNFVANGQDSNCGEKYCYCTACKKASYDPMPGVLPDIYCPWCDNDLRKRYCQLPNDVIAEQINDEYLYVLGNELENLAAVLHLDTSDIIANAEMRAKIVAHDLEKLKSQHGKSPIRTIRVRPGMNDEQNRRLREIFINYHMIYGHQPITSTAYTENEAECMLYKAVLAMQHSEDVGCINFNVGRYNPKLVENFKLGPAEHTIMINPTWDQLNNLQPMVKRFVLITRKPVPLTEDTMQLPLNQGEVLCINNRIHVTKPGLTEVEVYEKDLAEAMEKSTIDIGSETYFNIKVHVGEIYNLNVLVKSQFVQMDVPYVTTEDQTQEIEIPVFNDKAFLGLFGVPLITSSRCKVHSKLLKLLVTRNLSGELSFDALLQMGTAVANSRYSKSNYTISNYDITAKDIAHHAYIAKILNFRTQYKFMAIELLETAPKWQGLLMSIGNTIIKFVATQYTGTIAGTIDRFLRDWEIPAIQLQAYLEHECWDKLHEQYVHGKLKNFPETIKPISNFNEYDDEYHYTPLPEVTVIEFETDSQENKPGRTAHKQAEPFKATRNPESVITTQMQTLNADEAEIESYKSKLEKDRIDRLMKMQEADNDALSVEEQAAAAYRNYTEAQLASNPIDNDYITTATEPPEGEETVDDVIDENWVLANTQEDFANYFLTRKPSEKPVLQDQIYIPNASRGIVMRLLDSKCQGLDLKPEEHFVNVFNFREAKYAHDLTEGENNTCGLQVVNDVFNRRLTPTDIRNYGGTVPVSQATMMTVAEKLGENLLILDPEKITLCHYNMDSDYYYVTKLLIDTTLMARWKESKDKEKGTPPMGHWVIATGKLKLAFYVPTLVPMLDEGELMDEFKNKHNSIDQSDTDSIITRDHLATMVEIQKEQSHLGQTLDAARGFNVIPIQNVTTLVTPSLFRSNKGRPEKLDLNHHVPSGAIKYAKLLNANSSLEEIKELLLQSYNVPDTLPADPRDAMTNRYVECIKIVVRQWYHWSLPANYRSTISTHSTKLMRHGNYYNLTVPDSIKSGDIIYLKSSIGKHRMVVNTAKPGLVRIRMRAAEQSITVQMSTFRESASSALREMKAIGSHKHCWLHYLHLLQTAKTTLGVPGCGKTTTIVETSDADTTIVTKTRENRFNLVSLGTHGTVKSMEQAAIDKVRTKSLTVDECTMCDWMQLYYMITEDVKSMTLFGDTCQIGSIDMNPSPGVRYVKPVHEFTPQTEYLTKSYRIGYPLAETLKNVIKGFQGTQDHKTTVEVIDMEVMDLQEIRQLVELKHPDLVLCHYQETKRILKQILMNIQVETIHSFQGGQRNNVLVIQIGVRPVGIHLDSKYNISAATRAVNNLTWVSINTMPGHTLTAKILGGIFGGTIKSGLLKKFLIDNAFNNFMNSNLGEGEKFRLEEVTMDQNTKTYAIEVEKELIRITYDANTMEFVDAHIPEPLTNKTDLQRVKQAHEQNVTRFNRLAKDGISTFSGEKTIEVGKGTEEKLYKILFEPFDQGKYGIVTNFVVDTTIDAVTGTLTRYDAQFQIKTYVWSLSISPGSEAWVLTALIDESGLTAVYKNQFDEIHDALTNNFKTILGDDGNAVITRDPVRVRSSPSILKTLKVNFGFPWVKRYTLQEAKQTITKTEPAPNEDHEEEFYNASEQFGSPESVTVDPEAKRGTDPNNPFGLTNPEKLNQMILKARSNIITAIKAEKNVATTVTEDDYGNFYVTGSRMGVQVSVITNKCGELKDVELNKAAKMLTTKDKVITQFNVKKIQYEEMATLLHKTYNQIEIELENLQEKGGTHGKISIVKIHDINSIDSNKSRKYLIAKNNQNCVLFQIDKLIHMQVVTGMQQIDSLDCDESTKAQIKSAIAQTTVRKTNVVKKELWEIKPNIKNLGARWKGLIYEMLKCITEQQEILDQMIEATLQSMAFQTGSPDWKTFEGWIRNQVSLEATGLITRQLIIHTTMSKPSTTEVAIMQELKSIAQNYKQSVDKINVRAEELTEKLFSLSFEETNLHIKMTDEEARRKVLNDILKTNVKTLNIQNRYDCILIPSIDGQLYINFGNVGTAFVKHVDKIQTIVGNVPLVEDIGKMIHDTEGRYNLELGGAMKKQAKSRFDRDKLPLKPAKERITPEENADMMTDSLTQNYIVRSKPNNKNPFARQMTTREIKLSAWRKMQKLQDLLSTNQVQGHMKEKLEKIDNFARRHYKKGFENGYTKLRYILSKRRYEIYTWKTAEYEVICIDKSHNSASINFLQNGEVIIHDPEDILQVDNVIEQIRLIDWDSSEPYQYDLRTLDISLPGNLWLIGEFVVRMNAYSTEAIFLYKGTNVRMVNLHGCGPCIAIAFLSTYGSVYITSGYDRYFMRHIETLCDPGFERSLMNLIMKGKDPDIEFPIPLNNFPRMLEAGIDRVVNTTNYFVEILKDSLGLPHKPWEGLNMHHEQNIKEMEIKVQHLESKGLKPQHSKWSPINFCNIKSAPLYTVDYKYACILNAKLQPMLFKLDHMNDWMRLQYEVNEIIYTRWYSNFLKFAFGWVGARDGVIPAECIMSIDQHKRHNTVVYQKAMELANQVASQSFRMPISITISGQLDQENFLLLTEMLPTITVVRHEKLCRETMEEILLYIAIMNKNTFDSRNIKLDVVTTNPAFSIMNSFMQIRSLPPKNFEGLAHYDVMTHEARSAIAEYRHVLEGSRESWKVSKRETMEALVYELDKQLTGQQIWYGINLKQDKTRDLIHSYRCTTDLDVDGWDKTEKTMYILPIIDNNLFRIIAQDEKNLIISEAWSSRPIKVSKWLINLINNPIDIKNQIYVKTIQHLGAGMLYEMNPLIESIVVSPTLTNDQVMQTCLVPVINPNTLSWPVTGFFELKEVRMDTRLAGACARRMCLEDPTIHDLIAYARTELNSTYYGHVGIWSKHKETVDTAVNTAIAVYLKFKPIICNLRKTADFLTEGSKTLLGLVNHNMKEVLLSLATVAIKHVGLDIGTSEIFDEIAKLFTNGNEIQGKISEFFELARDMTMEIAPRKRKLMIYEPTEANVIMHDNYEKCHRRLQSTIAKVKSLSNECINNRLMTGIMRFKDTMDPHYDEEAAGPATNSGSIFVENANKQRLAQWVEWGKSLVEDAGHVPRRRQGKMTTATLDQPGSSKPEATKGTKEPGKPMTAKMQAKTIIRNQEDRGRQNALETEPNPRLKPAKLTVSELWERIPEIEEFNTVQTLPQTKTPKIEPEPEPSTNLTPPETEGGINQKLKPKTVRFEPEVKTITEEEAAKWLKEAGKDMAGNLTVEMDKESQVKKHKTTRSVEKEFLPTETVESLKHTMKVEAERSRTNQQDEQAGRAWLIPHEEALKNQPKEVATVGQLIFEQLERERESAVKVENEKRDQPEATEPVANARAIMLTPTNCILVASHLELMTKNWLVAIHEKFGLQIIKQYISSNDELENGKPNPRHLENLMSAMEKQFTSWYVNKKKHHEMDSSEEDMKALKYVVCSELDVKVIETAKRLGLEVITIRNHDIASGENYNNNWENWVNFNRERDVDQISFKRMIVHPMDPALSMGLAGEEVSKPQRPTVFGHDTMHTLEPHGHLSTIPGLMMGPLIDQEVSISKQSNYRFYATYKDYGFKETDVGMGDCKYALASLDQPGAIRSQLESQTLVTNKGQSVEVYRNGSPNKEGENSDNVDNTFTVSRMNWRLAEFEPEEITLAGKITTTNSLQEMWQQLVHDLPPGELKENQEIVTSEKPSRLSVTSVITLGTEGDFRIANQLVRELLTIGLDVTLILPSTMIPLIPGDYKFICYYADINGLTDFKNKRRQHTALNEMISGMEERVLNQIKQSDLIFTLEQAVFGKYLAAAYEKPFIVFGNVGPFKSDPIIYQKDPDVKTGFVTAMEERFMKAVIKARVNSRCGSKLAYLSEHAPIGKILYKFPWVQVQQGKSVLLEMADNVSKDEQRIEFVCQEYKNLITKLQSMTDRKVALIVLSTGVGNSDPEEKKAVIKTLIKEKFVIVIVDKNVISSDSGDCVQAYNAEILPFVTVCINHGGPGTVMTFVKAKIPQYIMPKEIDQHFWAEIIQKEGFGASSKKTAVEEFLKKMPKYKDNLRSLQILDNAEIATSNVTKLEHEVLCLHEDYTTEVVPYYNGVQNTIITEKYAQMEPSNASCTLKVTGLTTIYDPPTHGLCVQECILEAIQCKTEEATAILRNLVTSENNMMYEITKWPYLLGINMVIIVDGKANYFKANTNSSQCITLNISKVATHYHCTLCRRGQTTCENVRTYGKSKDLYSDKAIINNRLEIQNTLTRSAESLSTKQEINIAMMKTLIKTGKIKKPCLDKEMLETNMQTALAKVNIHHTIQRQPNRMLKVKIMTFETYYEVKERLITGKLYCLFGVNGNNQLCVAMLDLEGKQILMPGEDSIEPSGWIMAVGYNLKTATRKKIVRSATYQAINAMTSKYCADQSLCQCSPETNAEQLVIATFDNRWHHKYDERATVKKFDYENVYFVPRQIGHTMLEAIKRSFPRISYEYGMTRLHIDMTPEYLSKWFIKGELQLGELTMTRTKFGYMSEGVTDSEGDQKILRAATEMQQYFILNGNEYEYKFDSTPPNQISIIGTNGEKIDLEVTTMEISWKINLGKLEKEITMINKQYVSKTGPRVFVTKMVGGADMWFNAEGEPDRTAFHIGQFRKALIDQIGFRDDLISRPQVDRVLGTKLNNSYAILSSQASSSDQWDSSGKTTEPGPVEKFHGRIEPSINDITHAETGGNDDLAWENMIFWVDREYINAVKFAPTQPTMIKAKETAMRLMTTWKTTTTEFPQRTRPVFNKMVNAEFNAITGRLGSSVKMRTVQMEPKHEITKLADTYFQPGWETKTTEMRKHMLNIDPKAMREWLVGRPGQLTVANDIIKILDEGMSIHPINEVKIHSKLESLLKSTAIFTLGYQQARAIVWQRKGIAMLFSHMFKQLKDRLKSLLKPEVVYADGLTPSELGRRVRLVRGCQSVIEDDLAQQDRQTDHQLLDCEMELYKLMGANPLTIDLWRTCHNHWRYRATYYSGSFDAMRLTGQATTALGNVITNMICHRELIENNITSMLLVLMLGDDNLMMTKEHVNTEGFEERMKIRCNMQCSIQQSKEVGVFLQMLVYATTSGWDVCPNYVRLKNRYEVTSGVSEATMDVMNSRRMAYCCMLGGNDRVDAIWKNCGGSGKVPKWYNQQQAMIATAQRNKCTIEESLRNYNRLLTMMESKMQFEYEFKHWTWSKFR
uniref:Polyprotein n=1 Tax=Carteria obtusa associated endorna-like virus TaxID=2933147 RepID=A0A9C7GWY8_9VIRU|nr:polyprotein [Carteria obtusa associated endorna-like virus]CAI5383864.1 polyprotein [Carteria obtusa associated endorna-like virus]